MDWHLSAYEASLGSVTNSDTTAAADEVLQRRNSHLIFSEPFNLLAAYSYGANLSRQRFGNIALTVRGNNHIWPPTLSLAVPSRPRVMDLRSSPMELPLNEELTIETTTTAVGPANHGTILWLAKPSWRPTLPSGLETFITRGTVLIAAGAEAAWTALAAMTFERELFNGVYAVVGASVVAANAVAFRMSFPSQQPVQGRQLRPGGLVMNALGDFPWEAQMHGFGEWGRFHTFEPPSFQIFSDAAGGTYDVRLALVYLGRDVGLLRK